MYCVRFQGNPCSVGYIRPWNSVRDGETYSLTYLPTSFIDGIQYEMHLTGKIIRHKLRFNGMDQEFIKVPNVMATVVSVKKGITHLEIKEVRECGISTIHQLRNPEIILGFENKEDAIQASQNTIYVGQTQYMIFPVNFDDDEDTVVKCLSDEEFSSLTGTETFQTDENDVRAVYCGNNRYRNNEKMYVRIVRTK